MLQRGTRQGGRQSAQSNYLVSTDYDITTSAHELEGLATQGVFRTGLEFCEAPYPGPNREWGNVLLSESLRRVLELSVREVSTTASKLREIVSTTSQLAAARSGILIQRWALAIGLASLLVAALAAVAAIAALHAH